MNGNYCSESKNDEVQVGQLNKIQKLFISAQNESHTLVITSQLILIKRGKDNIAGGIFINYGELHDNDQHS